MGMIQKYEWGAIEWLTDQTRSTSEGIDIGITTIFQGLVQQKHIHYGDEQWLYIISGEGVTVVDQIEYDMAPGTTIHIPAGAAHETRNTGDSPMVQILISYPKQFDELWNQQKDRFKSANDLVDVTNQILLELGSGDVEIIRTFGETLALPITVYDTNGEMLFTWGQFPNPCCELCNIQTGLDNCHIYASKLLYSSPAYSEQSAHYCKYGLAVIDTPIVLNNQMVGSIRGGHVLTEDNADRIHPALKEFTMNLANIPKGRLRIILSQYKKLAAHLAHSYHGQLLRQLDDNNSDEISTTPNIRALKEDLDLALGRILNLQINNHFLFNTLNAIGGLALEEGSFITYRSIVDLSKMFRYNLRTNQEFVSIKEELDYIKNYSALQKIRFGDRLKMDIHAPDESLKYYIPFNTLQPLVENAFIHGFRNHEGNMNILLTIEERDKNIELLIVDNGQGLTELEKRTLIKKLAAASSPHRGLSMIIERLKLFFGGEFSYQIDSKPEEGFEIRLIIPKRTLREDLLGGIR